jgi:hypothetical protein
MTHIWGLDADPNRVAVTKHTSLGTRAVVRLIEAGSSTTCVYCNQQVKFSAKQKKQQVICNVYIDAKWNRVEHYHLECYLEAEKPHGEAA